MRQDAFDRCGPKDILHYRYDTGGSKRGKTAVSGSGHTG
jgi:hypothetical protein